MTYITLQSFFQSLIDIYVKECEDPRMMLRIILASVVLDRVISGRCGMDQYLNSARKCKDCEFCPAGQGMDLEEEVK